MTPTIIDGKTIAEVYFKRVDLHPHGTFIKFKKEGNYQTTSWGEAHAQILGINNSHKKLGLVPGDKIAIFSNTRAEWLITDLAILSGGFVTVPIYQSNTIEDIRYVLEHSEAKIIYAEDESLGKKLETVFKQMGKALPVVGFQSIMSPINGIPIVPFETFANPTKDKVIEDEMRMSAKNISIDTVATIVYTSGTTGQPKGAVLTHKNLLAEMRAIEDGFAFSTDDCTLAFLPFAHILGRIEGFLPLIAGNSIAFAENINTVAQNMGEIQPTVLVSVPRIYEKIYNKIQSDVASKPAFTQNIFNWATKIGREVARLKSEHKSIPVGLGLRYKIADKLVFTKIRDKFGGRVRLTVSGGAPLNPSLCEFFHAAGIKVIEGYGLTETTAAVVCNQVGDYGFGTVGKPMGDMELRFAADGEIQVRGSMVFQEYYKNPQATQEVLAADGWFSTGDIGEITHRGFLKITDRKKELIKTSGGKYIAPQKIENLLKAIRFISQGIVCGDNQKYVVALITLNEAEIMTWAKSEAIRFDNIEELTKNEKVFNLIEGFIKDVNGHLASYESIKKFAILPRDFTIEAGELTPSMKLKRKVCTEKYRNYVEALY